jgi:serine/threonine protein kinase
MSERKALIVGVNEYSSSVSNLNNCKNDALSLDGILSMEEYDFSTKVLLNEDATRRSIKKSLTNIFNSSSDFSIFYFAGHGAINEMGSYLLPYDTDDIDIGIRLDLFKRLVEKTSDNSKSVIILDCCHSGAALIRNGDERSKRSLQNDDVRSTIGQLGSGSALLAACKPNQGAYEDESIDHGLFTYYLLQALYGKAADEDGQVNLNLIYSYVSRLFEEETGQTPVFKGNISGSIVLGRNLQPQLQGNIPEDTKNDIEKKAADLINDHNKIYSADLDEWKLQKYKQACDKLKPIVQWIERKEKEYPSLSSSDDFSSAKSTAKSHLARLANLQVGIVTPHGQVERKIGSGTFGSVWKVNQDEIDVAYKVFHPNDLDKDTKKTRFKRGFKAMEQLDHPHIVDVYKFTRCPIGFTMEFINGPNLRDYASMEEDPSDILSQLITVADTLRHSHSRNVLHRDVKPENIVMSWQGESEPYKPHLTDFDLAWFDTATKFTTEAIGTMVYAPPEQLNKPQSNSARSSEVDVYSFGQLLFFFITKSDPVPNTDNTRRLRKSVSDWIFEEPARKLVNLYEDCTHDIPDKRISNFQEISDRLFDIKSLIDPSQHKGEMDFYQFSRQLAFSIVGLSKDRIKSETTFLSMSGRTMIEVINELPDRILLRLEPQVNIAVEGTSNYEEAKNEINKSLDNSLNSFDDVYRESGRTGQFTASVVIEYLDLDRSGIERCRSILKRAIDSVENT